MYYTIAEASVYINNKRYSIYFNGNNDVTRKEFNDAKQEIIKRLSSIIKDENKIKAKVYELYKSSYVKDDKEDDFAKDLAKDNITGFEINNISNLNTIGIFFSTLNQFFTEVNGSNKIDPKNTYVY